MKIEPQDLEQFRQLWKDSFQTEISQEEAHEKALKLLGMMRLVYRPLPKPSKGQLSMLDLNPNQS
jgi:hypothetical protein